MAKKPPDVKFDVPEDVFDDEKEEEKPEPEEKVEAKPEPEPEAKKEEEPETEAPAEEDFPPTEEPTDPAYQLAIERARALELERRLAAIEERTRQSPEDKEAAEDNRLVEQRKLLRERLRQAAKAEDQDAYQSTKWELDDLEQAISDRRMERQMRTIRGTQETPKTQQREPAYSIVDDFRRRNRVTPAEEARIAQAWPDFVKKNPAWGSPHVNPWSLMDRQLKLVRTAKPAASPGVSAVESGSRAVNAKTKSTISNLKRDDVEKLAAAWGMSVEEYKKQPWVQKGSK